MKDALFFVLFDMMQSELKALFSRNIFLLVLIFFLLYVTYVWTAPQESIRPILKRREKHSV